MSRNGRSQGTKLVSCAMSVVLAVGLMPLPSYASEGEPQQLLVPGTVQTQAGGVSYWDHAWDGAQVVATEKTIDDAVSVTGA